MNNNKSKYALLNASALALVGTMLTPGATWAMDGNELIKEKCLACHTQTGNPEQPYSRISEQRKTPEGWQMTLQRMEHLHGLQATAEEKQVLIKYLSDTQGLAPSETADYRYVLEQKPNIVEDADPAYAEMCGRCHSNARFGLQRRTEGEWKELVATHMAVHPTLELHALSRDRRWYDIALNETAPKLAMDYAFDDTAWAQWEKAAKPSLTGSWSVAGFMPEKGEYSAVLTAAQTSKDNYSVTMVGHYADGSKLSGTGSAKVFSGFEWRAGLTLDGVRVRQVMAASEDGATLTGRMYQSAHDEMGGELKAINGSAIVTLSPAAIKQGEQTQITIKGGYLEGTVKLGKGVQVMKVLSRDADRVVVLAKASASAAVGMRDVTVGSTKAQAQLAVYDKVAAVQVSPMQGLARIGGNGGKIPKVKSTFRAMAFATGADGKLGTDDDLNLGYMPASWSLKPQNEVAKEDKDLEFAGTINSQGIFTPGDTGLNPKRRMSANNVGMLTVVATVNEAGKAIEGEADLLVAVPIYIKRAIQ
ncbi:quinohemoprotein amine dehydrogenase subunit alpha [Amphritea sp. 1_MG-2023]|uniref:quinohemoprotein amine dehydrogenase subunit alpha n=1 Tax=Amphritea sp. 1_MG-2023 TaxID=3062670 RepID=UPI0026E321C8|nr:quinohemoprotein amine dehydrogenase subunit alpha [Amphritea sp. 1_MG-2023]MDO6561871.1 quinohemoprotein amine dehydrogenase subunit alpha [Amphritea sp. 1_MG-2023]